MFLNSVDHGLNSLCHLFVIHRWKIDRGQTKFLGLFHLMIDLSGSDERFAGNAPVVEAVTSQKILLFNEKRPSTKLGGSGRDGETCSPRTYNAHIKIIIRHDISLFPTNRFPIHK